MITTHRSSLISWLSLIAVGFGIGLFAAGCSWCASGRQGSQEQVAHAPPPAPPEPSLDATRDHHLTLFGEMPDQRRIPFQARAASPMEQHSFASEGADFDLDVSPDGESIVFASTRHTVSPNLYLKRIHGRAVTQITSDPAPDVQPCFSPDGRSIAFASLRSGNWDLWLVSVDGGQPMQITHSPAHEVHPSFSPDGRQLVFCTFNEVARQWELQTMHLAQPGTIRTIGVGLFPEWSPTGDQIVYQRARQRGGRWFSIWRIDLVQGEPRFPVEIASSSEMALIQPSWSPDGEWITYGTAELTGTDYTQDGSPPPTRGDIWIIRADGSLPMELTNGVGRHFGSVWSRDGRVYFTSLQNGTENVWSVRPLQARITQLSVTANDNAAVSPGEAPMAANTGTDGTNR